MIKDIKVLSFTHFLQGPSAVQMLSDLGADVIKIEPPKGAYERGWSGLDSYLNGMSVFFLLGNRNQRSISIDLRSEDGKEIISRLISDVDVIVENFRPGVMDRLGLGYEELKKINPKLVYCSCTGFGSDGPYRNRPGQDLLLQAMSGLATLSGTSDAPPTAVGTAIVDQHGAAIATFGILAALLRREQIGEGCKVESNLLNAALDLQIEPLTYFLNKGPLWDRSNTGLGSRFHQSPYGIYRTMDGWITISVSPIEKLIRAFGAEKLEAYTTRDQFLKRDEVDQIISDEIRKKTTKDWFDIFNQHDIWCGPVNNYDEVVADPQVQWNEMIMTVDHPVAGQVKLLRHPVKYDGRVLDVRRYPPNIGEHSQEILQQYGFTEEEISRFLEKGTVVNYSEKVT